MQAIDEFSDNAEVAAAAANCPEQVGVLCVARAQHFAGRGHHGRRKQVVDRETVQPVSAPHAATECEAAYARVRHDPGGGDEIVGERRTVQMTE